MKKIISVFVCAIILLTSSVVPPTSAHSIASSSEEVNTTGISMTPETFKSTFSGTPNMRNCTVTSAVTQSTHLTLSDISITKRTLTLNANLTTNNTSTSFPITGNLSAGFRSQAGINSIIVEVYEPQKDYNILLFEIYNDSTQDSLLITNTDTLSTSPHVKLYIQDSSDTMFLFEFLMPDVFQSLTATNYPTANKNYDALWWAHDFVAHQNTSLTTTPELLTKLGIDTQTRAANDTYTWEYAQTFYDTFYLAGSLVECWSLPYIEYKYTDVESADSTWFARFKIAERTEIQGITYYGTNAYQYRNLKISFGGGDKTIFNRTYQQGRFTEEKTLGDILIESGKNITFAFLRYTAQRVGISDYSTVSNILNNMVSTNKTIKLGTDNIYLTAENVSAVGEQLPTKYVFHSSTKQGSNSTAGDYYLFQAITQYEEGPGNASTTGILRFSFDVEYNNQLTNITRSIRLYYSITP